MNPLPVAVEAERYLLGCILIDQDALAEVLGHVEVSDFGVSDHRSILARIVELSDAGRRIEPLAVVEACKAHGDDLRAYVVGLTDGMPRLSNLESYTEAVKVASRRRQLIRSAAKVQTLASDESTPLEDVISESQKAILAVTSTGHRGRLVTAQEIIETAGGHEAMMAASIGQPSGFPDIDRLSGGLKPGEVIVVAGRPAMGKTALALSLAAYSARRDNAVGIFSLEMSKESLLSRMICAQANVNLAEYQRGLVSAEDRERVARAAEAIKKLQLRIDDYATVNPLEVVAKARAMKTTDDLGLIVIDYLQLMAPATKQDNRNLELASVSRAIKLMAIELQIPVLLLSQLSRGVEQRGDKRPLLSDLRDSGSIEQDADQVWMLYREVVYNPQTPDGLAAELIVRKNRNGPTGSADLLFFREATRFQSVSGRDEE